MIVLLATSGGLGADATSDFVGEVLSRPIINPDTGLAEVRIFAEAKVARMPEIQGLPDWERRAARMRSEALRTVVYRGEAAKWREAPTRVEW